MSARRWTLVCFALALANVATSCGDPALWARWQSDRALWQARRAAARALAHGAASGSPEWQRAEQALTQVSARFPGARWATPGVRGPARQVAANGARALLELGRFELAGGRDGAAALAFARCGREYAALQGSALEALLALVDLDERRALFDDESRARASIATLDPLGDPDTPVPSPQVLGAPLALAADWRALGRPQAADSLLAAAEARFTTSLAYAAPAAQPSLALALAHVRIARGDGVRALATLRVPLASASPAQLPERVLALASGALEAGLPDSVAGYADWVVRLTDNRRLAGPAMLLAAQALALEAHPDSALALYVLLLRHWPDPGVVGPPARFQRAALLERLGRWEAARGEYRALAAAYPTHPLAFLSLERIVEHHLQRGESDLARIQGQSALEAFAHLLVSNRDPDVQRLARLVGARLQLALGRPAAAESSFVDAWRRFPADSAAQVGALEAARLAGQQPGGAARARRLYYELSRRAVSARVRRTAGEALGTPGQEARQ